MVDWDKYLDRRLDTIIGLFTLTILFGKFLGDLMVLILVGKFGDLIGLSIGLVIFTILLFIWPLIEPEESDDYNPK